MTAQPSHLDKSRLANFNFRPREVIRLMVELLEIPIPEHHTSIYNPACGTGGMLYVAKEHLLDKAADDAERKRVQDLITLHILVLSPKTRTPHAFDLTLGPDADFLDAYKQALAERLKDELPSRLTAAALAKLETELTAYRKSLIHECVAGKRRITDADAAQVQAHA